MRTQPGGDRTRQLRRDIDLGTLWSPRQAGMLLTSSTHGPSGASITSTPAWKAPTASAAATASSAMAPCAGAAIGTAPWRTLVIQPVP